MGPHLLCNINQVTSFTCLLISLLPIAIHIKSEGLQKVSEAQNWLSCLSSTVSFPVFLCLQRSGMLDSLLSLELVKLLSILDPLLASLLTSEMLFPQIFMSLTPYFHLIPGSKIIISKYLSLTTWFNVALEMLFLVLATFHALRILKITLRVDLYNYLLTSPCWRVNSGE